MNIIRYNLNHTHPLVRFFFVCLGIILISIMIPFYRIFLSSLLVILIFAVYTYLIIYYIWLDYA
ncbi:MAG: hypothetical protein AABX66_03845 [Nanoarchaeota archaeon]